MTPVYTNRDYDLSCLLFWDRFLRNNLPYYRGKALRQGTTMPNNSLPFPYKTENNDEEGASIRQGRNDRMTLLVAPPSS
jgi:hypothetical protein